MPNRTLSFAYTACAALAALIAFLLAVTAERTFITLESFELVWITENEGIHDIDEVARTVQQVADDYDAAIGYTVPDVHEPGTRAHMYLAVSDPDSRYARWLADGYPAFSRNYTLETHPITEFRDVGPNGSYHIFGAPEARPALLEALADHGLHESSGMQVSQIWHYFLGGHLFNLLAVSLLATVTAVGAGVLLSARDYAVMRLQGHSYTRILLSDLGKVVRLWAIALPSVAGVTLAFLGFYNGWNQLGHYTLFALTFLAVLALSCLIAHAAVLGLVHTTEILPALKGRLPVRSTTVAIYLVRIPVLAMAFVILSAVVLHAQEARDQQVGLQLYEQQGDTSLISLSSDYGWATEEDEQAVDSLLGPWLQQMDAEGSMVLTIHIPLSQLLFDPSTGTDQPAEDASVLLVNDTYLAEQELLSPSGERYGPNETIRVIVPESSGISTDRLVAGLERWLAPHQTPEAEGTVEVLPAANGQTLFTYGVQNSAAPSYLPLVYEPIVVVLPNGKVLSEKAYVTYMTRGSTIFPDPDVVTAFRETNPEAARYISMVETLTANAAQDHATTLIALRSQLFNLAGVSAVLLLTAVAACVVYARARAQTIFARHISGWTFLATHRRLLAAELAIAAGFVGWITWDTLDTLQMQLAAQNDPLLGTLGRTEVSGIEPFYALGIAAASLAITVAALALFHRRIVREGASQA